MNDLVVGAWRNGLLKPLAGEVAHVEERRDKGFRQLPLESTVARLAELLDRYDEWAESILLEEQGCTCADEE